MNRTIRNLLYWSPRVLCVLSTLFLMLFSLDVLEGTKSTREIIIGLLMHNIPSFVLFGVLALAWKWEWVGAVVFPAGGLFYIYIAWMKFPLITYLMISGPFFMVGFLFLVNWIYRKDIRTNKSTPPSLTTLEPTGATL